MFKKIFKTTFIVTILFLLTGCGAEVKSHNPIKEDELIQYVKNEIYKETGDSVEVKILSKETLNVCTVELDGCISSEDVKGSYEYKIKVTNIYNKEISAEIYFYDSYLEDNRIVDRSLDDDMYVDVREKYLSSKSIEKILDNEVNYHMFQNKEEYYLNYHYIYLYTDNYDKLAELFNSLLKLDAHFDIYVIKDINFYNSIDFNQELEVVENIVKGEQLEFDFGFDYNLLSNNTYLENYSQLFLKFSTNGCSGNKGCTTLYGMK